MHLTWPVLSLYLAATLDCVLIRLAISRRDVLAAPPYALGSFFTAVWAVTYALSLSTSDLQTKILLLQIQTLVVPFWVLVWFETMYRFVRGRRCLTGWLLVVALIVPTITAALSWLPGPGFNPFFRYHFYVVFADGLPLMHFDRGPWNGAYNTYTYVFTVAGWLVLARSLPNAGWERKPRLMILAAWLIFAAADILWTLRISVPHELNYQPIIIPFVNILIALAIFRGRLIDLAPVVRASLVDNLKNYVVVVDLERRIVDLNRAAMAELGHWAASVVGRPAAEVLAPWPAVVVQLERGAEGAHEIKIGAGVYELAFHPALDNSGKRRATVLILSDITARKSAEERAVRLMAVAQAADEAKSRFLAMMSHEIRTPMSGMIGFTQMLSQTALTDQQREYLGYVTDCGNLLMVIIDDVLDFSKIEAGELQLERIAVEVRSLLALSCTALLPRARAQGLFLHWAVQDDVPRRVYADPVRLRQIINNLAGNAIKFTEQGGVQVAIALAQRDEEAGHCTLAVSVSDTGIGLSPSAMDRIFRPFSQAESSTTRRYGGTGLGLVITRRLCELMGGELTVTSEAGRGSIFTAKVRVALKPGPDSTAVVPNPQAVPARPMKILVVEDSAILERMITALLTRSGHTVRSASNGAAVFPLLDEAGPFDAILMDLQMQGVDGYMTVREIRRRELAGGPVQYIIALTAHALKGEREKCLEAGMNDYLIKPVNHAELWAALARAPGCSLPQ